MPVELERRESVVDAVATVLNELSPEDLRMRFGSGGRSGVAWLLADLGAAPAHRAYVARDRGVPVAVLDTVADDDGVEFGLVVTPSHRRSGIARTLVSEMLERTRRGDGAQRIRALCLPENRAAVALLRSAGFAAAGRWAEYVRFERTAS